MIFASFTYCFPMFFRFLGSLSKMGLCKSTRRISWIVGRILTSHNARFRSGSVSTEVGLPTFGCGSLGLAATPGLDEGFLLGLMSGMLPHVRKFICVYLSFSEIKRGSAMPYLGH